MKNPEFHQLTTTECEAAAAIEYHCTYFKMQDGKLQHTNCISVKWTVTRCKEHDGLKFHS